MKIDSSIKLSPLILLVLSLCFSSCTTTRTVERRVIVHDTLKVNRTDTLRFTALVRDSVYLHDSVYLEGATTVKERIKERWHIRTDTVWRTKTEALHAAHWETAQQKESPEPSGQPGIWWVLLLLAIAGAVPVRSGKK
jgi:hypothetical protein|nr:MAG TPA: hypothetical protein [Caudoviricetes sp.]